MKSIINKIVASVFALINLWCIFLYASLFYRYHFVGGLFPVLVPDWILFVNIGTGIIGLYLSILLFMNRLKLKFFLIAEFVMLLVWYFVNW